VFYRFPYHGRTIDGRCPDQLKFDTNSNCGPFAPEGLSALRFSKFYRYGTGPNPQTTFAGTRTQTLQCKWKKNLIDPQQCGGSKSSNRSKVGTASNPVPQKYLEGLTSYCDEYGISCWFFDEVQSGFARNRENWGKLGRNYNGCTKNISTYAKVLGFRIPIAAVIGKAEYGCSWHLETIGRDLYRKSISLLLLLLATIQYMKDINLQATCNWSRKYHHGVRFWKNSKERFLQKWEDVRGIGSDECHWISSKIGDSNPSRWGNCVPSNSARMRRKTDWSFHQLPVLTKNDQDLISSGNKADDAIK